MKASKLLKTLNYLPRWAWYLLSFFVAGPFGLFGVYLVFHVLKKKAKEEEEQSTFYESSRAAYEQTMRSGEVKNRRKQEEAHTTRSTSYTESVYADEAQETPDLADCTDVNEVARAVRAAMRKIRRANDIIADEALSAQINSIETSCGQILSILEQRPELLAQLRSFLRYYLPTTLRLLDARAKLERSARTSKAREVRARISEAVGTIDKAFLKQVEALDAYRFIDLESEMDVLRDMLKADGLLDDDEGKDDDPFAAAPGR